MAEDTRIPVSKNTRRDLKGLGSKGETYDDVITRLIQKYQEMKR